MYQRVRDMLSERLCTRFLNGEIAVQIWGLQYMCKDGALFSKQALDENSPYTLSIFTVNEMIDVILHTHIKVVELTNNRSTRYVE